MIGGGERRPALLGIPRFSRDDDLGILRGARNFPVARFCSARCDAVCVGARVTLLDVRNVGSLRIAHQWARSVNAWLTRG